MFPRIQTALGLALSLALLASMTVFAKGRFAFLTVRGGDLKEELRLSDPALTANFFTFADFYQDKTAAPADPGMGYEITRYYVDGAREIPFDALHYYPETGYVYYDGIVNGSSEYDDEWYSANPEIRSIFESELLTQQRLTGLADSGAQALVPLAEAAIPPDKAQPAVTITASQPVILVVAAAGILLASILWLRKSLFHKQPKGG